MEDLDENIVYVNDDISLTQNKDKIIEKIKQILPKLLVKCYGNKNIGYTVSTNSEFSYGYTNLLFHVKPIGDEYKESYLLRIYGGHTVVDRKRELKNVLKLQQSNIGPTVYGIFNNGRIERFYNDAVVIDPLKGYPKLDKIAKSIADFHKVKFDDNDNQKEGIWPMLNNWYKNAISFAQNDFNDNTKYSKFVKLDWNYIKKEIDGMKYLLPSSILNNEQNALKVMKFHYGDNVKNLIENDDDLRLEFIARKFFYERVLAHNDVYVGNVLELTETDEVILIDFEYVSYNFRAHDFATFFGRCNRDKFDGDYIADTNERKNVLSFYLKEFEYFKNVDNEFNVEEWKRFLNKCDCIILEFCMMNAFIWGIWAVNQTVLTKLNDFGYIDYARLRLHDQYNYFKNLWFEQYKKEIKSPAKL